MALSRRAARRALAIALVAVMVGCAGQARQVEVPGAATALGPGPALPGSLTLPGGVGPFPPVILLHGCSGLQLETTHQGTWNQLHQYADWYAAQGFAALVLDSFTSRGVRTVCTGGAPYPTMVPSMSTGRSSTSAGRASSPARPCACEAGSHTTRPAPMP